MPTEDTSDSQGHVAAIAHRGDTACNQVRKDRRHRRRGTEEDKTYAHAPAYSTAILAPAHQHKRVAFICSSRALASA